MSVGPTWGGCKKVRCQSGFPTKQQLSHFSFLLFCAAAAHYAAKQQTGSVPSEWVAKMASNWCRCVSLGRTVYVHLENGSSTLDAPSEGVQYDEGTFVADFEPIWASIAPDEGEAGALTATDTPRDGVVQPSRDTGDEDANDGAHVEGTSNLLAPEPPAEGLLDVRGQLQSEQLARRELEEQVRRDADAAAWQKEELDQMRERSTKAERRVKALQKERDMLRRASESKSDSDEKLREKEEQVSGLLAEGERMSRQLGEKETLLRRTRAQSKELEVANTALRDRLEATEAKLTSLQEAQAILTSTEKAGKKEIVDQAKQNMSLAAQVDEQERTIESLRRDNSDLREQLEKASADVTEHMLMAAKAEESVGTAAKQAEAQAKTQLSKVAEIERRETLQREEALTGSIEELRSELDRAKRENDRREDRLSKELRDAEQRELEAERRCQDLERMVPEATRPLLRQIEALQRSQDERAAVWQELEQNFQGRLQTAQAEAAAASERTKAVQEKLCSESATAAQLRERHQSTEADRATLEKQVVVLQDERVSAQKEHTAALLQAARDADARVHTAVEDESRIWATRQAEWEAESRLTLATATEDHKAALQQAESKYSVLAAQLESSENAPEKDGDAPSAGVTLNKPTDGGLFGHENAQAQMRQREGELRGLQASLTQAEATNTALAEELVGLTKQNEALSAGSKDVDSVAQQLESLQARHAAALEILGEKDEQLQAAQEDLLDVKQLCKK